MNTMTPTTSRADRGRIELSGLRKAYSGRAGVHGLDLTIEAGEFFTLLGPSGCGKTTTLMMLAGFVQPDSGDIRLDGRLLSNVDPQDRDIGVVFQNYALFPHLSVAQNLAFPLEMRRLPRADIERRVAEALALIRFEDADRLPTHLSGGQQQRVAVARALVFDPPVLLMDEPLGALDRTLRNHLQVELRKLQKRLGITTVYVTHDQEEAMAMSDRLAILNQGRIEQVGTPHELYENPASLFVARFLGDNNLFAGSVARSGEVRLDNGLRIPARTGHHGPDDRVTVTLRPERLRLAAPGETARLNGTLTDSLYLGGRWQHQIDVPRVGTLTAHITNDGTPPLTTPGQQVGLAWRDTDLHLFPASS